MLMGYNAWRKACPLAWVANLSKPITLFNKRRVPQWMETYSFPIQFGLLAFALYLRQLFLNDNDVALGFFFIIIIIVAVLINLFFSGKSWCNFFCPVGIVEKLYAGSNTNRSDKNSACSTCSACKKNCPDIDMESSYWKEKSDRYKQYTFYMFPGLIFGFYLYFYLRTMTWRYYFSGDWTLPVQTGYQFTPISPYILAALSLLLPSMVSLIIMLGIEKLLPQIEKFKQKDQQAQQHVAKIIAAYFSFNIFYLYAGAPTFAQFGNLYTLFQFIVVASSSIFLWKEIHREERFFLHERFASKIMKKLGALRSKGSNLKEVYYTFANQQKDKQEKLKIYKDALSSLINEGILTFEDMQMLDKIREQLSISKQEHDTIIHSLQDSSNDNMQQTTERKYQLQSYKTFLTRLIEDESDLLNTNLHTLLQQFNITEEEHQNIYEEIIHANDKLFFKINIKFHEINIILGLINTIQSSRSKEHALLSYCFQEVLRKELYALRTLLLIFAPQEEENSLTLFSYLCPSKHPKNEIPAHLLLPFTPFKKDIEDIHNQILHDNLHPLNDTAFFETTYNYLLHNKNATLLAAILLYYHANNQLNPSRKDAFLALSKEYNQPLVTEFVNKINNTTTQRVTTTIEYIAFLHHVSIFSNIPISDLLTLYNSCSIHAYSLDENIVLFNEEADSIHIITEGSAHVIIPKNGDNQVIATIHQGDYFGEIGIISDSTRTATIKAITHVKTVEIDAKAFKETILANPDIGLMVMKDITQRLREQKT